MKTTGSGSAVEIAASAFWPFGLTIEPRKDGLLLRPRSKPRAAWAKAFRASGRSATDDLAEVRRSRNAFDQHEWIW
jgi:hypothetical protein